MYVYGSEEANELQDGGKFLGTQCPEVCQCLKTCQTADKEVVWDSKQRGVACVGRKQGVVSGKDLCGASLLHKLCVRFCGMENLT